jgi:hypothetical protein
MAGLIGKAKRMKREGYFGGSEFKQIQIEGNEIRNQPSIPG